MEFTPEKFNQLKSDAELLYEQIGRIYCPYFSDLIHFNSKGKEHLIFKSWNKTRPVNDQFTRFKFIKFAPEIIKNSKTLQGIWKTQKFERVKKKTGREQVLKFITYYEFIAVVKSDMAEDIRIKIIVKQIEGGEKFFLSIIPFWGFNKRSGERILHSGDPEND